MAVSMGFKGFSDGNRREGALCRPQCRPFDKVWTSALLPGQQASGVSKILFMGPDG